MKVTEKIENRISRIKEGITFTYQELDISPTEYTAGTKAIERLIKKGFITRASTGLFYKPKKSIFGELRPKEEELLKPYLFEGKKRISYITGTALYNKMGLTTQVPKNIRVASRGRRIITKIGNIEVKPVKSYVEVTNDNYYLLEILDVLKDFKKIPDLDPKIVIKYIAKRIKELEDTDKEKITRIAFKYPPRVRAFLGAFLESLNFKRDLDQLKKSINPLTIYDYGIKKGQLSTVENSEYSLNEIARKKQPFNSMTETQLKNTLQQLRNLPGENEVVEFKEAKTNFDFTKLGKYFSALCNEANLNNKSCAWVVFGIENKNRNIVGSTFRIHRKDLDSLKSEIADKTTNRITFIEIYELNFAEGRVVLFQIPPAPKGIPVAFEGHYYGRDDEELSPLNLEEIERIRRQSNMNDWSSEIVSDASLADLDETAIILARANYKSKFQKLSAEVDSWDAITFLNKAKLTIQGKITKTALLLLGKSESEHFISPAQAKITWILKDKDNIELDYAHFSAPFILSATEAFQKIRNLKYRYIKDDSLFPEEVDMYDSYVIREALHNCIAHQDYLMGGKILVIEFPDKLLFVNGGSFLPGTVEHAIERDVPDTQSRNPFLVSAMFNLNMIDTIGSGIKRMYKKQSERFFPLPEYIIEPDKVSVEIVGKVLELDYARLLARKKDLSLHEIILLDKIQKHKSLSNNEVSVLKEKNLIEGRKPNYHISIGLAKDIGNKADYIKSRGFKDDHYKKMILEYLDKYEQASKQDIDKLILDILPAILNEEQKGNKVHNLLFAMSRKDKTIRNIGNNRKPIWTKNG